MLVGYVALHQPDGASAMGDVGAGDNLTLMNRTHEVGIQFQRGVVLLLVQQARPGQVNRRVGDGGVATNPPCSMPRWL